MSTHCRGICDRLKPNNIQSRLLKSKGYRRCSKCCIFMKVRGRLCPCCHTLLPLYINTNEKVYI